jgi:hypothetical protein
VRDSSDGGDGLERERRDDHGDGAYGDGGDMGGRARSGRAGETVFGAGSREGVVTGAQEQESADLPYIPRPGMTRGYSHLQEATYPTRLKPSKARVAWKNMLSVESIGTLTFNLNLNLISGNGFSNECWAELARDCRFVFGLPRSSRGSRSTSSIYI